MFQRLELKKTPPPPPKKNRKSKPEALNLKF